MTIKLIEERDVDEDNVELTFDLSETDVEEAVKLGVKLLFYCGALRISTDDAFTLVLRGVEVPDRKETELDPDQP